MPWNGGHKVMNRQAVCEEEKKDYFVGLAYQGKDIVFRFIIEYSSIRDFGP
jgi:hypothetical protein